MNIFSVNKIFFTILGYPMSYIELSATLLIIVYVLLITRKIVWAWPLGIVTFSLFAVLFYQIRLYSDFFEQFYYIGNCFYGWYVWLAARKKAEEGGKELEVSYTAGKGRVIAGAIIVIGGTAAGFAMSRIHIWLPALFPAARGVSVYRRDRDGDGVCRGGTDDAQENRGVDSLALREQYLHRLYFALNVKFVAILYIFFFALAVNGLITWGRELRKNQVRIV